MKKYNTIDSLQFGIAMYFIMRCFSLGIAIDSYIHIGGVDGYLSPIIGTLIGFLPLMIFIKLFNYKPNLNIFEKINFTFKKTGNIINCLLCVLVFFMVIISYWNLLNFITSQYLYRTSSMFISIIFGISIAYASIKNVNVILRVSNILFYISILTFIICIIGMIGNIKFNNLFPFLEYGLNKPLISGLAHVSYTVAPLFILLMIPKNKISNNKNISKYIILFYLLADITKFLVIFIVISTFGIDLSKLYEFPDFMVLRRMSTNGFFQRFESILATQWIFDIFIMITLGMQYIKGYYRFLFKKNENKFILCLTTLLCFICGNYIFKNNTIGDDFMIYKLPFILSISFIMSLLLYFKIKKT